MIYFLYYLSILIYIYIYTHTSLKKLRIKILFVCIFSHSNISSWYQSDTIPLCPSISVYRRPPTLAPPSATAPIPNNTQIWVVSFSTSQPRRFLSQKPQHTHPRATSLGIILRHVCPTRPSPVIGTPTQHLGFHRRPIPALFQPSYCRFGVVWTVGLYTSVPWPIFVSSSFVLHICYWILALYFSK